MGRLARRSWGERRCWLGRKRCWRGVRLLQKRQRMRKMRRMRMRGSGDLLNFLDQKKKIELNLTCDPVTVVQSELLLPRTFSRSCAQMDVEEPLSPSLPEEEEE